MTSSNFLICYTPNIFFFFQCKFCSILFKATMVDKVQISKPDNKLTNSRYEIEIFSNATLIAQESVFNGENVRDFSF